MRRKVLLQTIKPQVSSSTLEFCIKFSFIQFNWIKLTASNFVRKWRKLKEKTMMTRDDSDNDDDDNEIIATVFETFWLHVLWNPIVNFTSKLDLIQKLTNRNTWFCFNQSQQTIYLYCDRCRIQPGQWWYKDFAIHQSVVKCLRRSEQWRRRRCRRHHTIKPSTPHHANESVLVEWHKFY